MAFEYQLKITLDGIEPKIWRCVVVNGNTTLGRLHMIIQEVMGWTNSFLHEFKSKTVTFREHLYFDGLPDDARLSTTQFTLECLNLKKGATFTYLYDFGDNWLHTLEVENIQEISSNITAPRCLGGERNSPPENCGSITGYYEICKTVKLGSKKDTQKVTEWFGQPYDPEAFDLEAAQKSLAGDFFVKYFDDEDDDFELEDEAVVTQV